MSPVWALLALLAVDAFIIVLQIVDPDPGRAWSLYIERGYPEFYGYGKIVAAALVLLLAYRASREQPYRSVALVLVVIFLDDALALHETVGRWLADGTALEAPFGLRPSDIGELAALVVIGLFSLTILVVGYRNGDALSRQSLVLYAGLFSALTGFAVIVDMIHATLSGRAASVAAVAEEGGELVVLSLILCLAIAVQRRVWLATGRFAS